MTTNDKLFSNNVYESIIPQRNAVIINYYDDHVPVVSIECIDDNMKELLQAETQRILQYVSKQ